MAADGYLIVRTYSSSGEMPVVGATVSIMEQHENGARLIATRITDRSGRTTPIKISAPNKSESLSPSVAAPFTDVNIMVEHIGFERVLIENAQIFADIITEQNIEMIPLGEQPDTFNMTEIVDITPQAL